MLLPPPRWHFPAEFETLLEAIKVKTCHGHAVSQPHENMEDILIQQILEQIVSFFKKDNMRLLGATSGGI